MAARTSLNIAIEGCGHGTLDAIYAAVSHKAAARNWDHVDLLLIVGDFQAVRNAADLAVMSCPNKYKRLADFHDYYRGSKKAPYLTLFIGGNHEASSHLRELFNGGWVAPGIYYLGAAGVVRVGPLRIAGLSGIWNAYHYRTPHTERLPFSPDDIRSIYHVREVDVRRLRLIRTQVDVGLSHDWPRAIELHGDTHALFRAKPFFREDSQSGRLGSPAAADVMDHLRPAHWFSAHMHCRFTAVRRYSPHSGPGPVSEVNPDEIELDDEHDTGNVILGRDTKTGSRQEIHNPEEISLGDEEDADHTKFSASNADETQDTQTQIAAACRTPAQSNTTTSSPGGIANSEVRFLALDKCLPGRAFLELVEIEPLDKSFVAGAPLQLAYDSEWLAITRATAPLLAAGERERRTPHDPGEAHSRRAVDEARAWVEEHIVRPGRLVVPENFVVTAPPHVPGQPEIVPDQPYEYTNPQTEAYCAMLGIENLWAASDEERAQRRAEGPAPSEFNSDRRERSNRDSRGSSSARRGSHGGGRGGRRR